MKTFLRRLKYGFNVKKTNRIGYRGAKNGTEKKIWSRIRFGKDRMRVRDCFSEGVLQYLSDNGVDLDTLVEGIKIWYK